MSDDVSFWSEELARNPDSMVFLALGESLRRQGQLGIAKKVALRGVQRHDQNADAHDLVARISADLGDVQRALDEWERALRLQPLHMGALKGMGFVCFQQGRFDEAERYLAQAATQTLDPGVNAALEYVRQKGRAQSLTASVAPKAMPSAVHQSPPSPAEPMLDARALFRATIGDTEADVLLLDAAGLVLAGSFHAPDRGDVSVEVGAQLSGLPDEARRAARHLDLGDWRSIVFETERAVAGITPVSSDALVVLTATRAMPLGLLRRLLVQCADRGQEWLASDASEGDMGSASAEGASR